MMPNALVALKRWWHRKTSNINKVQKLVKLQDIFPWKSFKTKKWSQQWAQQEAVQDYSVCILRSSCSSYSSTLNLFNLLFNYAFQIVFNLVKENLNYLDWSTDSSSYKHRMHVGLLFEIGEWSKECDKDNKIISSVSQFLDYNRQLIF